MKIDILFPVLPPALDGIGDHTALLAKALSTHARVRVITSGQPYDAIEDVEIIPAIDRNRRLGILSIVQTIVEDPPDWLFVQFNQFSYGRWGLNPFLPIALRKIKRLMPQVRIAWMAHEDFVPRSNWKFAIMSTWQRVQFKWLGSIADHIFFSIEAWAKRYHNWFPETPVTHLPVGSNIPLTPGSKSQARRELGMPKESFVVGVFGTIGSSRPLEHMVAAIERLNGMENLFVLYVGPDGVVLEGALPECRFEDAGVQPPAAVSAYLKCMDMHLAPYVDGVSSRRGAFLAGIQHGVPSVTTFGVHTDSFMAIEMNRSFVASGVADVDGFAHLAIQLAQDSERRNLMGEAGNAFYDLHFTFDRTALVVREIFSQRKAT